MRTFLSGLGAAIALSSAVFQVQAQKETERYIPLGQSPGMSQKFTSIGEISHVDPAARTVTITEQTRQRTVKITDRTRIWLDRTQLKQANLSGSFTDLQKGRRIEMKYEDPERRQVADWVKVEIIP